VKSGLPREVDHANLLKKKGGYHGGKGRFAFMCRKGWGKKMNFVIGCIGKGGVVRASFRSNTKERPTKQKKMVKEGGGGGVEINGASKYYQRKIVQFQGEGPVPGSLVRKKRVVRKGGKSRI